MTNLTASDHVIRHVKHKHLRRDGDDNVVGCLWYAFQRRETESYLSVTWREYFEGDSAHQFAAAVAAIRKTWHVSPKSGFAIANVGALYEICKKFSRKIRVTHEPETDNPGHAAIRRLPRDETELLELLAAEAVSEVVLASDVP